MKATFIFYLFLMLSFLSCKQTGQESQALQNTSTEIDLKLYENFGENFLIDTLLSTEGMRERYEKMEVGDSLNVSFITKVQEVCQKKGCWMRLDLGEDSPGSFVKFKDYDFFVPMDAASAEVIVKGVAYKAETSLAELKHYAQDAGKSEEEIAAITQPKVEYNFLADGVYLKK